MNITRNTSYSLRALYEIEVSGRGLPVNRKHIARSQKISGHFMGHLFKKLSSAGITRSVRGPGGGFLLNKPADSITVWDIYRAVENKYYYYDKCALHTDRECDLISRCQVKHVWSQINRAIQESMSAITLKDICRKNTHGR